MKIKTQKYDSVTVVGLQGDFDGDHAETFQSAVTGIASEKKCDIVIDMSDVSFIDSHGLELLLWAGDCCMENNCQLRLAGLSESCSKILEITRLEGEFDCYSELSEAVKSFA